MNPQLANEEDCYQDAEAFLRAFSGFTDFNDGSGVKTAMEAMSNRAADIYRQIAALLSLRNLDNVEGDDLDREGEIWTVPPRMAATPSSCRVRVRDGGLFRSTLQFDATIGANTFTLQPAAPFAASGPYTLRIGLGSTRDEDRVVATYDTVTGIVVLGTGVSLENAHAAGETVTLVSGAADRAIAAGLRVQVRATAGRPAIPCTTTEAGTLVNGEYESTDILAESDTAGAATQAASGEVNGFLSTPPFAGADVTSVTPLSGGTDRESDQAFRDRIRKHIQSLSRGIRLAIEQAALGVQDPATKQRVATARAVHDLETGEVALYIDDGTGMTADRLRMPTFTLATNVVATDTSFAVDESVDDAARSGFLVLDGEVLKYSDLNYSTRVFTLAGGWAAQDNHTAGAEVATVEVLTPFGAADNQKKFRLVHRPILRDSLRVWTADADGQNATLRSDLFTARGTGDVKLETGVAAGQLVVAHSTYYTGLVATVQRIISGEHGADATTFPGYAADGVNATVEVATVLRQRVVFGIAADTGYREEDLIPLVAREVSGYLNTRGVGEAPILTEALRRGHSVPGVRKLWQIEPSPEITEIAIAEDTIFKAIAADGSSMIEFR